MSKTRNMRGRKTLWRYYPGDKILYHIEDNNNTVLLTGSTGQVVEFNKNGDAKGRYTIYQFQRINATKNYNYVPIGSWTDR